MAEYKEKDDSTAFGKGFIPARNGFPVEPWHSTPLKKNPNEAEMERETMRSHQSCSNHASSPSLLQGARAVACEVEVSIIQKQRTELQLLIAELKERDQELNIMTAAHHRQLQSWENDRQRVLTLEQRCARLEDELQKRSEVIRAISKRLKAMEAQEKDSHKDLLSAQQKLQELALRQEHSSQQRQELEEKNQSLNSSIMSLSSQLGQMQVHEEELASMLKLKDKDMMEATNHILALTNRLRESETSLKESRSRESKVLRETEEYKRRFREARHVNAQLRGELQEKTLENNHQREELICFKQENHLLRKELALTGEGESWKDELLGLARSKQERTDSELLCLRQVCEKQQNDLQLLKLNLESTREALRQYDGQRSLESLGDVIHMSVDGSTTSPQRIRSPAAVDDAAYHCQHIIANGSQEKYVSSTSRLQRLLAESKQMVENLERSSGDPLSPVLSPALTPVPSPALSPASRANSVCSIHSLHNNSHNSHNQCQSPTSSHVSPEGVKTLTTRALSASQNLMNVANSFLDSLQNR